MQRTEDCNLEIKKGESMATQKFMSPKSSILSYKGLSPKIEDDLFLACGARVIGDVRLSKGVSIWFNTVIRGDVNTVSIGENSNIQDNTLIHCTYKKTKTIIGSHVSIGHSAIIHGCRIEDNSLIGMCVIIMDNAVIEKNVLIGAGSLIPEGKKIPEGYLAYGRPIKVIRKLKESEIEEVYETSLRYLEYKKGYDFRV